MQVLDNPWRKGADKPGFEAGLDQTIFALAPLSEMPFPSIDRATLNRVRGKSAPIAPTPLVAVGAAFGVGGVWVKDERARMGLGSFKALGAAYAIAYEALLADENGTRAQFGERCFVTASAGNHGLSVAHGAAVFGAKAVVYLCAAVPEIFAERLRDLGADVVRAGDTYEQSMDAAQDAAEARGWTLLSDSSWTGYSELPHRLMEGYLTLAIEAGEQMPHPPTHIFLQAGVGGLAAVCAAWFRHIWGNDPQIIVVEPDAAPALFDSISAGRVVETRGPVSNMGRLDCKVASLIAFKGLVRDADRFVTISDDVAAEFMPVLAARDLASTPSGGAGIVALNALSNMGSSLGPDARALCVLSEVAE